MKRREIMQRMRKVMLVLVLACCLLALSACPDDGEAAISIAQVINMTWH